MLLLHVEPELLENLRHLDVHVLGYLLGRQDLLEHHFHYLHVLQLVVLQAVGLSCHAQQRTVYLWVVQNFLVHFTEVGYS